MSPSPRRLLVLTAVPALVLALGAPAVATSRRGGDVTLHLGYFPNVTHASAIVGVEAGIFEEELGSAAELETATFNAGPAASEALLSGAIDATYIGPNPAINAYAQSGGEAIRIVSGATSGGAYLVVQPDIDRPRDLDGKVIASPQLGNTQDVALRTWLKDHDLETNATGGGDVSIRPQDNAQTLELFTSGDIDGAWVPEPWATRLVDEGGGKVLVDERDLWPQEKYVTTHLIVRTEFLEDNPSVVRRLLQGQVAANDFIANRPDRAQDLVAQGIERATGSAISPDLVAAAFGNLTFTNDPIAASLRKSAKNAEAVGLLEPVDLDGIYDLSLLNKVLKKEKQPTVKA